MIKVKHRFDIGDDVWFIDNDNKIYSGLVTKVELNELFKTYTYYITTENDKFSCSGLTYMSAAAFNYWEPVLYWFTKDKMILLKDSTLFKTYEAAEGYLYNRKNRNEESSELSDTKLKVLQLVSDSKFKALSQRIEKLENLVGYIIEADHRKQRGRTKPSM